MQRWAWAGEPCQLRAERVMKSRAHQLSKNVKGPWTVPGRRSEPFDADAGPPGEEGRPGRGQQLQLARGLGLDALAQAIRFMARTVPAYAGLASRPWQPAVTGCDGQGSGPQQF